MKCLSLKTILYFVKTVLKNLTKMKLKTKLFSPSHIFINFIISKSKNIYFYKLLSFYLTIYKYIYFLIYELKC